MPRQPFPTALDVAWHNYLAQIEGLAKRLDTAEARIAANSGEQTIGKDSLAAGFGHVLVSETRVPVTRVEQLTANNNTDAYLPAPSDGIEFIDRALDATTAYTTRFRITYECLVGYQGIGTQENYCAVAAFLGNDLSHIGPVSEYRVATSGYIMQGNASFWCDPGRLIMRVISTMAGSTQFALNAFNSSGGSFWNNEYLSSVHIEEWAVI